MLNLFIKHDHVPVDFKLGVIKLVIKDKRKYNEDVSNYRLVTIICVLAKLFEMCLYTKLVGYCGITGMQDGFEKGGGCERSISTVMLSIIF